MSRISKWKPEKTKVKVVFRLQFHATHIPLSGWDKLFISFIPADSGKATAKTTKASVRNGSCKWADPIYETTRLLQDIKTKQYDDKLYKIMVAMGSSRSSFLGEATINLAGYADALKPSSIALPLQGCDSGATLHVAVQLLTSKTGFREFEQQRELRERGLFTTSDQNNHNDSSSGRVSPSEEITNDPADNARVRFGSESRALSSNDEEVDSPGGFDGSSNTSGSLYAEKHDLSSAHEIDSLKSNVSGDLGALSLSQSPHLEKVDPSGHRYVAQGTNAWVRGWGSEYSVDNDLANASEENSQLRDSLELAESSLHELKLEVSSLQSHADDLAAEAQNFAQQLASEMASGENLAREVAILKSECSKFKGDLEVFKINQVSSCSREPVAIDQDHLVQDLQLRWLRGLLLVEDKLRELQSKVCFCYHDRDDRFLGADLEALLGLLHDLKQGTGQAVHKPNIVEHEGVGVKEVGDRILPEKEVRIGFGTDLYQPESMMHNPGDIAEQLKDRIVELVRELDESKVERESLTRKMGQMECYYEALIQELEGNQRHILGELQNLRNEHSACLYAVSSSNAEMERMHQDMNEKMVRFTEEKCELDVLNKELERRATAAEAALKRARLNYSIAVGQLQKDLEVLASQVSSMYEANENLIKQAFEDCPRQSSQANPKNIQIRELSLPQCQNQSTIVNECSFGGDVLLDDMRRSLHIQEELYRKVEEEVCDMHLKNIYLEVFSRALQESLIEASSNIDVLKDKMGVLMRQLECTSESKELLMLKLQTAMDDMHSLNEEKGIFLTKYDEVTLQNRLLKENMQIITQENYSLVQKVREWESLMAEYSTYKSKYETSATERTEFSNILKKQTEEFVALQNENGKLKGELEDLRCEFNGVASLKENVQTTFNNLLVRLQNLLMAHHENVDQGMLLTQMDSRDAKSSDLLYIVSQLETFQNNSHGKIFQLMEEKEILLKERETTQHSLDTCESNCQLLKEKLENDLQKMLDQICVSNSIVQKLHVKVDAFADRLTISSKTEETCDQHHTEIISEFSQLEADVKQLTLRNEDLVQEIQALENINEELEKSLSSVADYTNENRSLMESLQNKTEESLQLAVEVSSLKDNLHALHKELSLERSNRDRLECMVGDLTSQLNEKHSQLLCSDAQEAELVKLRLSVSDYSKENHSLMASLQDKVDECAQLELEISGLKESLQATNKEFQMEKSKRDELESTISDLTSQLNEKQSLVLSFDEEKAELAQLRQSVSRYSKENCTLIEFLQEKADQSAELASEVSRLKECLQALNEELRMERSKGDELGSTIIDLTSQLNEKHCLVLSFDVEKAELIQLRQSVSKYLEEIRSLKASLQEEADQSAELASEISRLRESLQALNEELQMERSKGDELRNTICDLTSQLNEKHSLVLSFDKQKAELVQLRQSVSKYSDENCTLLASLQEKGDQSAELASEISRLKESFRALNGELEMERNKGDELGSTIRDLSLQLNEKNCLVLSFDEQTAELIQLRQLVSKYSEENLSLSASLQEKDDQSVEMASEISKLKGSLLALNEELQMERSKRDELGSTISDLTSQLNEKQCLMLSFDEQKTALIHLKQTVSEYSEENHTLMASLQDKIEESARLRLQVSSLKETLQSLHEDLRLEKSNRDKFETTISELSSQLNERNSKLLILDEQKDEIMHLRKLVSDLELQESKISNLLLQTEENLKIAHEGSSSNSLLENDMLEMHKFCIAADIELVFTRTQYETLTKDFVHRLGFLLGQLDEHQKYHSLESRLNGCLANEERLGHENAKLLEKLKTLQADLEASQAQNTMLLGQIETRELSNYGELKERRKHDLEIERLKQMLQICEEEINALMFINGEQEVQLVILKGKVDEQCSQLCLLEGCDSEVIVLQKQCTELSRRLSEQVLKTEEFKNLSTHLKDLKDKAEAENIQAQEKKEAEGQSFVVQESLRIAFIKEQYETKVQELKRQLSISKKHSEEMLWKLQDAVDDVENRKKAEAASLKKNEELSMKLLESEAELQQVVSERREKSNAYDRMKAEMECSLISLECCKEEKKKLEASLQESKEVNSNIAAELAYVKDLLESSQNQTSTLVKVVSGSQNIDRMPPEDARILHSAESTACTSADESRDLVPGNGAAGSAKPMHLSRDISNGDAEWSSPIEGGNSSLVIKQDLHVSKGENGNQDVALCNFPDDDENHLVLVNDHFKVQGLKSSMDNLNKELEKMKSENWLVPEDDHEFDPKFQEVQREQIQLDKANEELSAMFPSFNSFSTSGNALERVLALEIELAEALKAKKKSSINFQSSFLRQHGDEEAIFKSFRDINELIKEMLELKGKYSAVESELKEMQERYSQLSLQFAEVEGERQKLTMTLKCVRSSKKAVNLNRSSSASMGDHVS